MINRHINSISHRSQDTAPRSRKSPNPSLSDRSRGHPSNVVIKLAGRDKALRYFSENFVILASATLSQYNRVTDGRQTEDRRHLMAIAELAMQLQRSASNFVMR